MAFLLPALPKLAEVVPGVTDNSARLTPTSGAGASQTILRPGRFYVTVSIPALDEDCANEWLAAMLRHKTEPGPLRLAWPRIGAGLPVAAAVDGAGQGGALLSIKGLGAGGVLKPFTPFSFTSGGASYMHRTTSAATANGAGKATVTIGPTLRVSPADNLALAFTAPVIEGDLDPGPFEWTESRLRTKGFTFKISER